MVAQTRRPRRLAEAAGCQQLISTGTSPHPSGVLGVGADGKDAFFFTREVLVPEDKNGEAMKIYDAREQGGYFLIPPPPPCAASDECHGAGTQAQAPPQIGSYKGTGGQAQPTSRTCKKGFKLKRGKCVKKKHRKKKEGRGGTTTAPAGEVTADGDADQFAFLALLALAFAAPAQASIVIDQFDTTSSENGAGTHPDLTTTFKLAEPGAQEATKDVVFEAPEGVFGNPNAVSECTAADFAINECSPNSQAGLVTVVAKTDSDPEELLGTAPIFVLVPQEKEGETARLSFVVPKLDIPIAIPVSVRTGSDYGLRFTVKEISQLTPLAETTLTFWGYPADPVHNSKRFPKGVPGSPSNCPGIEGTGCLKEGTEASIPVAPLIDYPTTCTGQPLVTELQVRSYQDPGAWSTAKSQYPPVDGCEKANFNPVLSANLTTGEADSASGLDLTFNVPQPLGRNPTPSQLKKVTVTLPPGVTINPDAADGQSACTDAQANFGTEGPAECPDNAKIGTVSIYSPALNGALVGSMYIGQPKPGEQYRLFEILSGFGLNAKLVGTFRPDPQTGQLTGTFENLPQVPFEEFDLHLFASDRGLIATPTSCAVYSVEADFIPWNVILSPQKSERFLSVTTGPGGQACPGPVRPFQPRLAAGMLDRARGRLLRLPPEAGQRRRHAVPAGRQLQDAAWIHRRSRDRLLLGCRDPNGGAQAGLDEQRSP